MSSTSGSIVRDLEEQGFLVKTEDYSHNVGTCYRCIEKGQRAEENQVSSTSGSRSIFSLPHLAHLVGS